MNVTVVPVNSGYPQLADPGDVCKCDPPVVNAKMSPAARYVFPVTDIT